MEVLGEGGGNYLSVGEMGRAYLVVLLHMNARACMPLPDDNSYGSNSIESTVPCHGPVRLSFKPVTE